MAVTIADISSRTGLSYSTVAEILRDRPGYRPATRRRVLKIAQQLGYRPNPLGKALAGGKSMSIGLISATSTVVAYTERLIAVNAAARRNGYTILSVANPPDATPQAIMADVQGLLDRRVDGLIVSFNRNVVEAQPLRGLLQSLQVPLVYLNADRMQPMHPNEVSGRMETAASAVAHRLRELGHARAIFVATPSDRFNPRLKAQPYIDAFAVHGMQCVIDDRWTIDPTMPALDSVYEIVSQMIRERQLPTVLIMTNDQTALTAMAAVVDAGLSVPKDVSIVGFDDGPEARYVRPSLTSVRQPGRELGEAAFAMLLSQMHDPAAAIEARSIDCTAVFRDSVGPAPQRTQGERT